MQIAIESGAPLALFTHTTVAVTIQVRHAADVPVAALVAEALREFMAARPEARAGTFETKAGLDVSWVVTDMAVDADGTPTKPAIMTEFERMRAAVGPDRFPFHPGASD